MKTRDRWGVLAAIVCVFNLAIAGYAKAESTRDVCVGTCDYPDPQGTCGSRCICSYEGVCEDAR